MLLVSLNDDAARIVRSRHSIYTIGLSVSRRGWLDGRHANGTLLRRKLIACLFHLFQKRLAGVHLGIGNRRGQASGIHIALPMGTHDDTALAVHIAAGHDGIGTVGIDFRKQQG